MAYYADLEGYMYGLPFRLDGVLTVGWLSSSDAFVQGEVDLAVVAKLKALAIQQPAAQTRGRSGCELCGVEEVAIRVAGREHLLGSAEIWVPHPRENVIYAAPDLVVHYMEAHCYSPPAAFLEAVAAVDAQRWNGAETCERILDDAFRARH